jgi:hypothetical protein
MHFVFLRVFGVSPKILTHFCCLEWMQNDANVKRIIRRLRIDAKENEPGPIPLLFLHHWAGQRKVHGRLQEG